MQQTLAAWQMMLGDPLNSLFGLTVFYKAPHYLDVPTGYVVPPAARLPNATCFRAAYDSVKPSVQHNNRRMLS